ncbi:uncharacterized protein LOC18014223 [Eutrema salsugineum]|uniref:uncharacterized protein LOC18014223 n=1 Tax=Eutrema salsugineum TaxID=72664 RepID=UPI000CECFB3A|nr:uncharacterized protein LOC18014223 [Eutrema salsugineum]
MSEYQSSDEESNEIRWTGEDCEEVGQSSGEENGENPRDYEENDQSSDDDWLGKERRCIVSDPAHPHNLSRVTGYKTTKHNCISCGRRSITWELSRNLHYYCTICQVEFHRECRKVPTSTCRVCYKNVDIKYGQYSCNHGDCSYVAHSKCATQHDVWDKKELEWEPEESDETKDIAPYKKVGVGLIEHFCHQNHFLKLEKYDGKRDSRKKCQACMRSITSHDFYNCIECDYFLHEVCANLSRQLDHLLHIHSLVLNPHDCGYFTCSVCLRNSSGWTYICSKHDECNRNFYLDVNCSLNPECFNHESHVEHLLFAATGTQSGIKCRGCYNETYGYHLQCTICKFAICYKCSTIPNEIYYKFDEHPLSLCYGESGVDGKYWCEVCEERLDPNHWFYTNTKGCTTIHYECVFGNSYYMKTGLTFNYRNSKVEVVANGSSRPKCQGFRCYKRCLHPEYLKWYKPDGTEFDFCSFNCLFR